MPKPLLRRAFLPLLLAPGLAAAQSASEPGPPAGAFLEIVPTGGHGPVRLAASQVVRIGRAEGYTVIDTAAYVQQRTVESPESVARRVAATGHRLVALTDPSGQRCWVAPERVVLVRGSEERHAAGSRAALVLVGLRFGQDVAVRESVEEVMAALGR